MTGESRGGSRAAGPGCCFSRGATARSEEALLINEYILNVNVLDVSFEGDTLTAQVNVTTIYGEVDVVV